MQLVEYRSTCTMPSTTTAIPFRFMVKGNDNEEVVTTTDDATTPICNSNNSSTNNTKLYPLLKTDVSLSFWGGIDPITGIIIDTKHPLWGQRVTDTIFVLPSGRGSCTASQVLLELILNNKAPRAIVLRDNDPMVAIGAIIAQEIFHVSTTPDIVHVGINGYHTIMNHTSDEELGCIHPEHGLLHIGKSSSINNNTNLSRVESKFTISQQQNNNNNELLQLTDQEIEFMKNCTTDAQRMAFKVIFRYARICTMNSNEMDDNDDSIIEYVPISSSHIDGCTYIGPGGLQFVQQLVKAGGKVVVPTTLNSVSTDRQQWEYYGVPMEYATKSIALGDAYLQLGCIPSFTCAPYLLFESSTSASSSILENTDIAWGESNAVVYSNSILGARTEKYADYLDVCCAIAGIVPAVGVHLPKNRIPTIVLDATVLFTTLQHEIENNDPSLPDIDILFPTLGYLCGLLSDGHVPMVIGLQHTNNNEFWKGRITNDHWKAFCAAYGTTGSSPLIHIAGITPEVRTIDIVNSYIQNCQQNTKQITLDLLQETYDSLNNNNSTNTAESSTGVSTKIDLIALGNPHLSISECNDIAKRIRQLQHQIAVPVQRTTTTTTTRIVACMSRTIREQVPIDTIQCMVNFGIEFVYDTCWCMILNEPLLPSPVEGATILTNSGKYAHYGPGLTNRQYKFGSLQDCIETAITGYYNPQKSNKDGNPNFLSRQHRTSVPKSHIIASSATTSTIPKREYSTIAMMTTSTTNQLQPPPPPLLRYRRNITTTKSLSITTTSTTGVLRSLVNTIRRWR